MNGRIIAILAGALALGLPAAATAADLLPPAPELDAPAQPVAIGSGWYLRGDVGYIEYDNVKDTPYGAPGIPPMDREKIEEAWSLGLGVGYRVNNWFRVDATVDHRFDSQFSAFSSGSNYVGGYSLDKADFSSTTVLANAYVDLGTWYGITPYVGAGLGFAHNTFSDYRYQVYLFPGPTLGVNGTIPGDAQTNLAWALMAGVGVELGQGITLDAGYRYVNLGPVKTKLDAFNVGTKLKDIDAHEVRFGVRWLFAGTGFGSAPHF